MTRFDGPATLIRKGRTVPGWETKLGRFNNLAATWPTTGSPITCFYQGTVADIAATSSVDFNLTVALWAKIPVGTTVNKGIWAVNSISLGHAIVGMYWNHATAKIRVAYGSQAVRHEIETDFLADGKWHCIVFSSKVSDNLTRIRVDNGPIVVSSSTGAPCAPQGGLTNPIVIGYFNHPMLSQQYNLAGVSIDELVFSEHPISVIADFDKLYNLGLPPDINDAPYWSGSTMTNNLITKWFRFDFDPNNSRTFSSGLVNSADGGASIATPLIHSSQLPSPIAGAVFPSVTKDTTHANMPDYAALAGAWGDWSKGLTFPSYGSRFALGTGVEVRIAAPGLMPESMSGWGYYLQSSWITLNTQEPFSTPTLETIIVGTGLFDDSLPAFNNDLQAIVDGRNLSRRDGLFAKKV